MSARISSGAASKQDYDTPRSFLAAVERRFGPIAYDLAAHAGNHVVERYYSPDDDSLRQDWGALNGNLWCNPPFTEIAPWAAKCATSGARVLLLVPASVGSEWYAKHVHEKALVLALRPRLSFDGRAPYPKDCILAVYGERPGFDVWDWREAVAA